jgi:hypothetical protein
MDIGAGEWTIVLDTAVDSPLDIHEPGTEPVLGTQTRHTAEPRSLVPLRS